MNSDELYRLIDLMPASGRMYCKIEIKPEQPFVITAEPPLPWQQTRPIAINLDLWTQLTRPQRDLLLLRTVSWLMGFKWFKPDLYQGLAAAGLIGTVVELVQFDAIGTVVAGTLTALAGLQIAKKNRSTENELAADEAALRVAERRGYAEAEAARHLLGAIESVAKLESRPALSFVELIRCQNLRAIAGFSATGVPEKLRQE